MAVLRLIGYWRSERTLDWPDPAEFVDEGWDEDERHMIVSYLESATIPWTAMGFSPCRICGEPNGSVEFTDGVYLWPEGLAHYVSEHAVRLPFEFVDHVMKRWDDFEDRSDIDESWWRAVTPDDRYPVSRDDERPEGDGVRAGSE